MDVRRIAFLFALIAARLQCAVEAVNTNQNTTVENLLRKHIFKDYDKVVIPTTHNYELTVYMKMMIKSAELDYEKSQMLLSTWFISTWIDNRLTWDPNEFDQISSIIVDHHEIWHPDVMAFNNVDANMGDDRTLVNSVVNNSGSVIWVEPVQYSIHCQTDTTYWPHDTQTGVLKLGSWMYKGDVLNLTTDHDGVEVVNSHSEWEVLEVTKARNVRIYPCCPDEQFIDIEYYITIKRRTHPYQSVVYIPALCCASFNLIVFWLPYSNNYYKVFANMFNASFVALIILIMYSKIPVVTSSIPLIIVYYTYSMALIAITAIVSIVVKNISSTDKPLPHRVTQFLHSGYMTYFGIETNDSTTDCHALCESEDITAQTADSIERQKLSKVIDRTCFALFAFIYLILLLRFMP